MAHSTPPRRVIAAINATLDGFCDHTYGIADDDLHDHYSELLRSADTCLYGRKTYELMLFWQELLEKPSGTRSLDEFALTMDKITKVVFSHTLKQLNWSTARLAQRDPASELAELRKQPGGTILIGSPSLISAFTNQGLIDELQLCVHPVIAGKGLRLFQNVDEPMTLVLERSKTLSSGATVMYYRPKPS